jgi:hypothetical protein
MSTKIIKRFITGSRYFFDVYPDFYSKDIDILDLVDTTDFKFLRQLSGCRRCLFQVNKQPTVDHYIDYALQTGPAMAVCKFLVPEFCEEIGFKFSDLPKLQPLIDTLDRKHAYLKIIFESYLRNAAFTLTEEQRLEAYSLYKEARK